MCHGHLLSLETKIPLSQLHALGYDTVRSRSLHATSLFCVFHTCHLTSPFLATIANSVCWGNPLPVAEAIVFRQSNLGSDPLSRWSSRFPVGSQPDFSIDTASDDPTESELIACIVKV